MIDRDKVQGIINAMIAKGTGSTDRLSEEVMDDLHKDEKFNLGFIVGMGIALDYAPAYLKDAVPISSLNHIAAMCPKYATIGIGDIQISTSHLLAALMMLSHMEEI